ncbi:hypothetical protein EXIGLDRAFT_724199 [Exidia glandulosa HHB12029]|uniref:Uncharacterized protein n=1 Tax=Exidia glandulosa HHB12029 TaxID=1314781 RepID=A0A165EI52_EXIGL|nr:hypothetical protein EXIGLDRAFT_724199 [Exidia glandulosa HHB12029]
MWRSNLETNPFPIPPPGTNLYKIPTKTALGVFNTSLNDVWDDSVAPQILASMKAHGLKYSALKTARFLTVEDGGPESYGPIVVWIAVRPNTTNAGVVRDATPDPPYPRRLPDHQCSRRVVRGFGRQSGRPGSHARREQHQRKVRP